MAEHPVVNQSFSRVHNSDLQMTHFPELSASQRWGPGPVLLFVHIGLDTPSRPSFIVQLTLIVAAEVTRLKFLKCNSVRRSEPRYLGCYNLVWILLLFDSSESFRL
jgi:hypothetical protein